MREPQVNFYLCHVRWNNGDGEFFVVLANDMEEGKLRAARAMLGIYGDSSLTESNLVNISRVGFADAQGYPTYSP